MFSFATYGNYILLCNRQYSTDFKLDTYLKIARLYLEDDDAVQAEAFINRASLLQNETGDKELQILYKVLTKERLWINYRSSTAQLQVCYARVLDYRRKFIEAAQRYNELSYKTMVAEEERMNALQKALICAILASAGASLRFLKLTPI